MVHYLDMNTQGRTIKYLHKYVYIIGSGILVVAFFAGNILAQEPATINELPQPDKNPNSYSNPERPTFDAEGNKYDYNGNQIPFEPTVTGSPSCQQ